MTQVSWDMVGHGDFQWVGAGSAALVNVPIGFDSSSSVGAGAGVSGSSSGFWFLAHKEYRMR